MNTGPVRCAIWARVSTDEQDETNQVRDLEQFAAHHGYEIAARFILHDASAWKGEHRAELRRALDAAHRGEFSVMAVWALDRISREGAEDALRTIRLFRQRGCMLVSVQESWLNGSPEVQDVLVAFAGWRAEQESKRRSERTKAGIARKQAQNPDWKPGRQAGATDKGKRRRSGYVAGWERGGARRAAEDRRAS